VNRRAPLLGLLLAAGLARPLDARPATAGPRDAEEKAPLADTLTPALQARLAGAAGLGDLRIDVFWSSAGRATSARVFGDGIGTWQGEVQFQLPKDRVLEILRLLEKSGFAAMPDRFGEDEEGEKDEGPRLRGQLMVRAGAARKTTIQLVDGEQSKPFAGLVEKILQICEGPARSGVRPTSLDDALRLVAADRLSPRMLEATVQRRPGAPGAPGVPGWLLRLDGLDARVERMVTGQPPATGPARALSGTEFHALAALLSEAEPSTLPQSLYAESYTDLTVRVMKYSRTVAGRRYRRMNPQTHGERQKAFDRIVAAFDSLHTLLEAEAATPSGGESAPHP